MLRCTGKNNNIPYFTSHVHPCPETHRIVALVTTIALSIVYSIIFKYPFLSSLNMSINSHESKSSIQQVSYNKHPSHVQVIHKGSQHSRYLCIPHIPLHPTVPMCPVNTSTTVPMCTHVSHKYITRSSNSQGFKAFQVSMHPSYSFTSHSTHVSLEQPSVSPSVHVYHPCPRIQHLLNNFPLYPISTNVFYKYSTNISHIP